MKNKPHLVLAIMSTSLFAFMSTGAIAQTARSPGASEGNAAASTDIIVTAQKREQNVQDVPIAVSVVSAATIQNAGVLDVKDLTLLTPGLTVRSSGDESLANARIRGVGTQGEDDGLESSVGLVIDGVYRPRLGVGIGDLGEVERVEVLKGPQGTLFGRNNTAGVISVTTRAPSFDFGLKGEFTTGNYSAVGGSLSITGPIVDDVLAARVFVARRERDGFNTIRTGGGPRTSTQDMTQDYYTLRGQLLFTPTSTLTARLIVDYSKRDENCCILVNVTDNQTLGALTAAGLFPESGGATLTPADPSRRIGYANRDATQKMKDRGISLQVDWETPWFDGAELTSITGLRKWSSRTLNDYYDWTSVDLTYGSTDRIYKQFSQEIRLAGNSDLVDWLVGGYFSHEVIKRNETINFGEDYNQFINTIVGLQSGRAFDALSLTGGIPFAAGITNSDRFRQKDDSWALFTHNTFHITDKLDLTLGIRYTSGKRKLDAHYSAGPGANACGGAIGQYNSGANPAWLALSALDPGARDDLLSLLCVSFWDPRFGALGATRQSRTERKWSGTANIAYHFTQDLMAYASYSRGYKGGGYNFQRVRTAPSGSASAGDILGAPNPDTSFSPEFTDNYEIGIRSQWFDRTLTVNATLFKEIFTDYQRNDFRGTAWYTFAVPKIVTEGVDLDFSWKTPIEGLSLRGGGTYADARTPKTSNPPPLLDPRTFGKRLAHSARYTGSIGGQYRRDISPDLTIKLSADLLWTDAYPWRVTGQKPDMIPQETRLNARIGIGGPDDRWSIELWGQNLLDETHIQAIVGFPLTDPVGSGVIGVLTPPRTYGLTARIQF